MKTVFKSSIWECVCACAPIQNRPMWQAMWCNITPWLRFCFLFVWLLHFTVNITVPLLSRLVTDVFPCVIQFDVAWGDISLPSQIIFNTSADYFNCGLFANLKRYVFLLLVMWQAHGQEAGKKPLQAGSCRAEERCKTLYTADTVSIFVYTLTFSQTIFLAEEDIRRNTEAFRLCCKF